MDQAADRQADLRLAGFEVDIAAAVGMERDSLVNPGERWGPDELHLAAMGPGFRRGSRFWISWIAP